jgi:hypothetical protein
MQPDKRLYQIGYTDVPKIRMASGSPFLNVQVLAGLCSSRASTLRHREYYAGVVKAAGIKPVA